VWFRQSRTLVQASKEYRRRYGREPPKGFDKWWKFCVVNDVRIVDDVSFLPLVLLCIEDGNDAE
jgi:hypothetical protein